jgi:hypothetical protein
MAILSSMNFSQRAWSFFLNLGIVQALRLKFGKTFDGLPIRDIPYVFIIGFNKTGTRSLTSLFVSHGIPSVHWDANKLVNRMLANFEKGRKILHGYDNRFRVFSDFTMSDETALIEGNQFYVRLFNDYPGAVFVLNTRPTENWINSRIRHGDGRFLARTMKSLEIDDLAEMKKLWASQKETFETEVRDFFKDKPELFVEVDIEGPRVAEKLSNLLPIDLSPELWAVIGEGRHAQTAVNITIPLGQGRGKNKTPGV